MEMEHPLFVHNIHKDKELGLCGLLFCIKGIALGPEMFPEHHEACMYLDGQFVLSCSGNQIPYRKIINQFKWER